MRWIRAPRLALTLLALPGAACNAKPEGVAVPARTQIGSLLRWTKPEVVLRLSPERLGAKPPALVVDALGYAIGTWNSSLGGCGAPRLRLDPKPLKRPAIRLDSVNEVLFHSHEWCAPRAVDDEDCYDPSLHGSTRLRPERRRGHPSDGVLKEADMEINGADFKWSRDGRVPGTLSLDALFVHELGHVLGLAHPCAPLGSPARKSGRVSLGCDDPRLQNTVMQPHAAVVLRARSARPTATEVARVCRIHQ